MEPTPHTEHGTRFAAGQAIRHAPGCWCGNLDLAPFGRDFLKCRACETLVSAQMPRPEMLRVTDEERDFYGRGYWFSHVEGKHGQPNILTRSTRDLPERCLYWLRTALKYKLPPAPVLELGSAHGGFVHLLRWAGFDATGLEMSAWVVEFARQRFNVPMLFGPVESQQIVPGSLELVVLMDVLEHLPDPAATIRHCLSLLRPDGVLMIQTPRYPEGTSYEKLVGKSDRFLEQLKPVEHVYLFSRDSIRRFFTRLGCDHLQFEPAIFPHYDMFLAVSRAPLATHGPDTIKAAIKAAPGRRLLRAFLHVDRLARLPVVERHQSAHRLLRRTERIAFRFLWKVVPSLPKGS
jgi:SAM-dependent methyltransferase